MGVKESKRLNFEVGNLPVYVRSKGSDRHTCPTASFFGSGGNTRFADKPGYYLLMCLACIHLIKPKHVTKT